MLRKSPCKRFYQVFSSFSGMLIWKMSPKVLVEITRVFVSRLTADDKYPVEYCDNMQLPNQMQFSKKPKTFSELFIPFLDSTSNFQHLEKNDDCYS